MGQKNFGEWSAWTYLMDFIPHVYVKGIFPTNGVKPVFTLSEVERDGSTMVLELHPEGFNPEGKEEGKVSTAISTYFKIPSKVRIITGEDKIIVAEVNVKIKRNRGKVVFKSSLSQESLEDGCWIIIYRDTNYRGDSLLINGPAEFRNMQSLPNANQDWGDQIGSVKTGPSCWVIMYADDDFGDTNMVVGPGSQIPDLADLEDEVDSIRILNHRP